MNAIAYVTMKSREPIGEIPELDFCTIGGFAVGTEGNTIHFDWILPTRNMGLDQHGFFYIDWVLGEYDEDFFKDANEGRSFPGWNEIIKMPIYEVYYEAGEDGNEQRIKMDLESFNIYEVEIGYTAGRYKFSKDQIEAYNKSELKI